MPAESAAARNYLASLNGAAPDMGELQRLGVPMQRAIALCSARHKPAEPPKPVVKAQAAPKPELNLAAYVPPIEPPRKVPIVANTNDVDRILCLSLLHTVVEMISGNCHIDPTRLAWEGLSDAASNELCNFMRRAK